MTELFKRVVEYRLPFKAEDNLETRYPHIKDLVYNLYALSYYDGPLSGIGYWNGKICFFKHFVEEYITPIDDENEEAVLAADEARDNGFWRRFFVYDVPEREAGYLQLAFHAYSIFVDSGNFPSVWKYKERKRASLSSERLSGFYKPGLKNPFRLFNNEWSSIDTESSWYELKAKFASNANLLLSQFTRKYGIVNLEKPEYIAGWIDADQIDYL